MSALQAESRGFESRLPLQNYATIGIIQEEYMVEPTNPVNDNKGKNNQDTAKNRNPVLIWVVILGIIFILAFSFGTWNIGLQLQDLNNTITSTNGSLNTIQYRLAQIEKALKTTSFTSNTTTTTTP
jgi:hypothetical protein